MAKVFGSGRANVGTFGLDVPSAWYGSRVWSVCRKRLDKLPLPALALAQGCLALLAKLLLPRLELPHARLQYLHTGSSSVGVISLGAWDRSIAPSQLTNNPI